MNLLTTRSKQVLLDFGVNIFGLELLVESLLKSKIVDELYASKEPIEFVHSINRQDCKEWQGLWCSFFPIKKEDTELPAFTKDDFSILKTKHLEIGCLVRQLNRGDESILFKVKEAYIDNTYDLSSLDGRFTFKKVPKRNIKLVGTKINITVCVDGEDTSEELENILSKITQLKEATINIVVAE